MSHRLTLSALDRGQSGGQAFNLNIYPPTPIHEDM